jgi:5-methyltetrahydrofolate--homocysteine methyltransferase
MQAVRGADVLMDHDPQCANWISAYRQPTAAGSRERRSTRRRRGEAG